MVPINQVFLGGSDPLLGSSVINSNLDEQLQLIEKYKQSLEAARQMKQQIQQVQPLPQPQPQPQRLIWDEIDAEHLVSDMYHTENGRKYTGEKFDMHKAKEICERYRGILPTSVTPADVYVAINSQYHDYAELFKNWFGNDIEQKVVESAIVFWFKDADAKSENKLVEYFREH